MTGEHPADLTEAGWSVPEDLESVHGLFERGRTAHPEVDATAFMLLETAVVEVAGNVVEHGRPTGRVRWTVTLRVTPDRLQAVLADDGQQYDGDLDEVMPDLLAESGRGLALARAALDEFDYARVEGNNVWTMSRRLPTPA